MMNTLRELIHNSEHSVITFRGRKSGDKIHRDVGPGVARDGKRAQQASRGQVRSFPSGADRAGRDKFPGISGHIGPPEASLEELKGPVDPRMTGKL